MAVSSNLLGNLLELIPPKKVGSNGGTTASPTYDPNRTDQNIPRPSADSHRVDLSLARQTTDDKELIADMMRTDTEMSATTNAYLTVANTRMRYVCRDMNKVVDRNAQKLLDEFMLSLTTVTDYSLGFSPVRDLNSRNEAMRYMLLKRGAILTELVIEKNKITDLRLVDTDSIEWREPKSGVLKPFQQQGQGDPISLDFPTVFYASFRKDPADAYGSSFFLSTINTIYARKQILNDFYRILKIQGFPRLNITLIEDVIRKNAPLPAQKNPEKMREYIESIIGSTAVAFGSIRPDQPIIHTNNTEVSVINEKAAGASLDIQPIINVLNGQNQAGLKVMSTLIGRGESGVNTASTESRIFSMSAAELNRTLESIWAQVLTFVLRLSGSQSYVEVTFEEPELRSRDEREANWLLKQQRLQKDLSLGLISDDDYHLEMYGRLRPDDAPELSGTNFLLETAQSVMNTANSNRTVSDQPDSVERQATGGGATARQATSNANQ